MKTSIALKTLLGAAALTLPLMAFAESNVQTGAATAAPGATAHVDFSIVIPKILYLRVGTGSTYTTGALTSDRHHRSHHLFPGGGHGGQRHGGCRYRRRSHRRRRDRGHREQQRQRHARTPRPAARSATAPATRSRSRRSPRPPTTLTSATRAAGAGADQRHQCERRPHRTGHEDHHADAKWTFSYANTAAVPAGTYGGVNVNNSRVIYTATMP